MEGTRGLLGLSVRCSLVGHRKVTVNVSGSVHSAAERSDTNRVGPEQDSVMERIRRDRQLQIIFEKYFGQLSVWLDLMSYIVEVAIHFVEDRR